MSRSPIAVAALGLALSVLPLAVPPAEAQAPPARTVRLSSEALRDKIRGGWAAQTIGVTFGGPTEFSYNGTIIPAYTPIRWDATRLRRPTRANRGSTTTSTST